MYDPKTESHLIKISEYVQDKQEAYESINTIIQIDQEVETNTPKSQSNQSGSS